MIIFRLTTNKFETIEENTEDTKKQGSYCPVITDDLRQVCISTLKKEIVGKFNSVTDYGIEFSGNRYQCGKESISDIVNAKSMLDTVSGTSITWRTYNNINVTLSYADFVNMAILAGQYYQTCFAKRSDLIDALITETNEELAVYDVDTEWSND